MRFDHAGVGVTITVEVTTTTTVVVKVGVTSMVVVSKSVTTFVASRVELRDGMLEVKGAGENVGTIDVEGMVPTGAEVLEENDVVATD